MKENQEHYSIYVEQAKDNNDLRYMITENTTPMSENIAIHNVNHLRTTNNNATAARNGIGKRSRFSKY
ncbi:MULTISPECIES: hypothetical protein [Oceanobacillus]|uniref:hypothetical protein n=1 Tax=Oceanobacillus TaxID=182709 RepID=UPI000595ACCD|nr:MULTISPECIES: hypothetical protein [Oceanobacillus]